MTENWHKLEIIGQYGDEDFSADHPLSDCSFYEIEEKLNEYKEKYPSYRDWRFHYVYQSLSYGAASNWWELQGLK